MGASRLASWSRLSSPSRLTLSHHRSGFLVSGRRTQFSLILVSIRLISNGLKSRSHVRLSFLTLSHRQSSLLFSRLGTRVRLVLISLDWSSQIWHFAHLTSASPEHSIFRPLFVSSRLISSRDFFLVSRRVGILMC